MDKQLDQREKLKKYYGKVLEKSKDLKTNACCSAAESVAPNVLEALKKIDDEILIKYYGCGSPIPFEIEGLSLLDLGCGTGRDVYIASQLVGPDGFVIGVDMTDEQLEVAQKHIDSQTQKFGYATPNISFKKGFIENLKEIGIEDNSMDIVISNCVINLSPEKEAVFSEIFRVLKPGGELYFSDVFSGRRVPEELKNDPVLHGECLAGALYMEDFRRLLEKSGCLDYRIVSRRNIDLDNPDIENKIGMVDFYSMTIRAFKLEEQEDIYEDYGQIAIYQGSMSEYPHFFDLDDHHRFITGKPAPVCGNTAAILEQTRFAKHFTIIGDRSVHYGPFDSESGGLPDEGHSEGSCC